MSLPSTHRGSECDYDADKANASPATAPPFLESVFLRTSRRGWKSPVVNSHEYPVKRVSDLLRNDLPLLLPAGNVALNLGEMLSLGFDWDYCAAGSNGNEVVPLVFLTKIYLP